MSDNPTSLSINGGEYIRKDAIPNSPQPMRTLRIVIADRGWVFVGNCEDHPDGTITITNCRNIRRWGTSAGLGELVNGPTEKTVSDVYGTVRCLPIATIAVVKGW